MRRWVRTSIPLFLAFVGLFLIAIGGVCLADGDNYVCDSPTVRCPYNCYQGTLMCGASIEGTAWTYNYINHPSKLSFGYCEPEFDQYCVDYGAACPTDYFNDAADCPANPLCSDERPELGCIP